MAFKELADLDCGVSIALGGKDKKGKANPTRIEGYYIGSRDVPSAKSKTGFAKLHVFQTQKGNVGVWGKTNLDQKMTSVTPGAMVRVSFVGMVPTKNNPMYKYKVEVDAENTIEVASGGGEEASDDTGYDSGTDDSQGYEEPGYEPESDVDQEEPPMDEAPPARPTQAARKAAPPSAERQAKVQQLLSQGRTKLGA
jgi:hypothetical protein